MTSADGGPVLTGVVRCDPVVRGPDVAPPWPQRSTRATPSLPFVLSRTCNRGAEVKRPRVSVVDRGEPEASCSNGTEMAGPVSATAAGRRAGRHQLGDGRPVEVDTSLVGKPPKAARQ